MELEEAEEDDEEEEELETKKDKKDRIEGNNKLFYQFFKEFLKNEVQISILPNLRLYFNSIGTISDLVVPTDNKEYFQALLNSADKQNERNNHRQQTRSRSERLKLMTKVINAMKRLPQADFVDDLHLILLELIKLPDAEYQGVVLNCIKKADKGGKIVNQYFQILNKLISRESFKNTLLELNVKVKTFEEMEKDAIMPIASAILFRKLLDKKGTGNFKNFNSIRDFVLECVKNFREEDIDSLIRTIFSSFNCDLNDIKSVNVRKIALNLPLGRLGGLLELCNNLIKKFGPKLVNYLPFIQEFVL